MGSDVSCLIPDAGNLCLFFSFLNHPGRSVSDFVDLRDPTFDSGFPFFSFFLVISLVSELIFILFFCLLGFHFLSFFQFLKIEAEVTAVSRLFFPKRGLRSMPSSIKTTVVASHRFRWTVFIPFKIFSNCLLDFFFDA